MEGKYTRQNGLSRKPSALHGPDSTTLPQRIPYPKLPLYLSGNPYLGDWKDLRTQLAEITR
jgi:hypothetical protein